MEFTTHFELQSQATRLVGSGPYRRRDCGTNGTATLLGTLFKSDLAAALPAGDHAPLGYNSGPKKELDFKHELFPLHSPLLRESLLVSFPPLSYMLKFSGSSCLIGGSASSLLLLLLLLCFSFFFFSGTGATCLLMFYACCW